MYWFDMDIISLESNIMTKWNIYKARHDLVLHCHPAVHSSLCQVYTPEVIDHIGNQGDAVAFVDDPSSCATLNFFPDFWIVFVCEGPILLNNDL